MLGTDNILFRRGHCCEKVQQSAELSSNKQEVDRGSTANTVFARILLVRIIKQDTWYIANNVFALGVRIVNGMYSKCFVRPSI